LTGVIEFSNGISGEQGFNRTSQGFLLVRADPGHVQERLEEKL